jgi:hypothetical protein
MLQHIVIGRRRTMTDHHSRTASEEEEVSKLDSPLVLPYIGTLASEEAFCVLTWVSHRCLKCLRKNLKNVSSNAT